MQRRQFLHSALVGAGALLPGTGATASQFSADSVPIPGLVLPPLDASEVHDVLILFIRKGLLEAVKSLLGQGVDVNAKEEDGWTPLHHAVFWSNNVDILKCLVSRGADVNAKNNDGETPLHFVAGRRKNVDMLKYLISVGADANAKDKFGKMPLHVVYGNNKCVKEKKRILGEAMKNPEDHFFALRTIDWDAEWN